VGVHPSGTRQELSRHGYGFRRVKNSAVDAAATFGITMGANTATSVFKEFLPDLLRHITHKKPDNSTQSSE
jgi:hypothetical protein